MANSTADTPEVSETELANMKIDQLREHARKLGIDNADELHQPELLAKVKDHHYAQAHGGRHRDRGDASAVSSSAGHVGGNRTADTPEVSETELANMKIDQLREHARKLGIDNADELHQPELLAKVKDHHYAQTHEGRHRS
jgi:transcription termination factor Rho